MEHNNLVATKHEEKEREEERADSLQADKVEQFIFLGNKAGLEEVDKQRVKAVIQEMTKDTAKTKLLQEKQKKQQ